MPQSALVQAIIGDGAAGIAAARVIRAERPSDRIVIVSDDPQPSYYRAALTNYLSGDLSDEELWALPADAWEKLGFERVHGQVACLDRSNQSLRLADGRVLRFDRMLIASGTRATSLPASVLQTSTRNKQRHIHVLRTLKDVKAIIERASNSRRVVILGGGILGIEAAHGLHKRNLHVSLIHRGSWLMDRVIDRRAGALIQMQMARNGIALEMGAGIQAIEPIGKGERVTLTNGDVMETDMVLACIGVTPNTEWLADSGVSLEKGYVVVDGHMRVPGCQDIWAAGDVAVVKDPLVPNVNPGGLWQPAQKQGQVAGLNMADESGAAHVYRPGFIQNSTVAWHMPLASAGAHVDSEGEALPAVEERSADRVIYKRALLNKGRLVGFMLLGDRREASALCRLMNLRGSAANVELIKHRLFDRQFDLFGWVAAQETQPGVTRWKATLFIPRGPVPPSIAARTPLRSKKSLTVPNTPAAMTGLWTIPVNKLTLSFNEQSRTIERGYLKIGGRAQDGMDIVVPSVAAHEGHLAIAAAGAGWLASPVGERMPLTRNGLPLNRPFFLADCDVLQVGAWKAVVRLEATGDPRKETVARSPQPIEFELLGYARHKLVTPVTMIGRSSDNHIVLADSSVGFTHAQLSHVSGNWYVQDAGSATGTKVNGEAVIAPRRIAAGDVLEFGAITLVVRKSQGSESPQATTVTQAHVQADCYLVCIEGPMAPRAIALTTPATVGRGETADVIIGDALLSRLHARIIGRAGSYTINDLGSINGTLLNGDKIPSGTEQGLTPGAQVRLGTHIFRFETKPPTTFIVRNWQQPTAPQLNVGTQLFRSQAASTVAGCELIPMDDLSGAERSPIVAKGAGPHVFGRAEDGDVLRIPLPSVSKRHAEIAHEHGRFTIRDLGSSNGTRLNGQLVGDQPVALKDGDEIRFHVLVFKFQALEGSTTETPVPSKSRPATSPARFANGDQQDNPLESDLTKVIHEELDACIGCHLCMRVCPLPTAQTVTIAALNAYAAGLLTPTATALQFVEDCTQCHACVPVCPVNIRRSRIVLWNKLKSTPDRYAPVVAQVADKHVRIDLTRAQISDQLQLFPLFAELSEDERLRYLESARVRQLAAGEQLLTAGLYVDALWVVLSGQLESGAQTESAFFQRMNTLLPGQTVGERAVLGDSPCELSVRAVQESIVIGIPKYTLRKLERLNARFKDTLETLYLARTTEALLRSCSKFVSLTDAQIRRLSSDMRAERYNPGQLVLTQRNSTQVIAVVVRGFIKQVSLRNGAEIVSNYLKAGDWFGADMPRGSDAIVRWDAATLAEVVVVEARLSQKTAQPAAPIPIPVPTAPAAPDAVMQAHRLMVIDTRKCVDCDNCVDACARRHGYSRIDRSGSGKQVGPFQIPGSCYHCEDPVCLLCAVDGIVREPTGEIRILEDNCIGCGACAERCPYDNIQMVPTTPPQPSLLSKMLPTRWQHLLEGVRSEQPTPSYKQKASKCDLCSGYADGPACVRSCPTGAAQRIDPMTFFRLDRK